MDNLEEIRKRINSLDAQMTSLFEERMLQCRQVALFKREHGLSITDSAREAEVIAKNSILVKDDEIREYYARFQKGSMDTYTMFIELAYNILRKNGCMSMIVPISLTSSDSLQGVHRILKEKCDDVHISSYAVRPQPVFNTP